MSAVGWAVGVPQAMHAFGEQVLDVHTYHLQAILRLNPLSGVNARSGLG